MVRGVEEGTDERNGDNTCSAELGRVREVNFSRQFLTEAREIITQLDDDAIERVVQLLVAVRDGGGRLFVLGVGGSAANASHAVNDFRKIAGIEAYAPTDNVAE